MMGAHSMSSRERMLAALSCEKPDHVPLAFMLLNALNERMHQDRMGGDPAAFIEAELALGVDAVVDLTFHGPYAREVGHPDAPGIPVMLGDSVETREWAEERDGGNGPELHKEYATPSGRLSVVVDRTDDWPYGAAAAGIRETGAGTGETADCSPLLVPLMDDFLAPRCSKHLVESDDDLPALRHLLAPPTTADIGECRSVWSRGKELAEKHGLLVAGGWGVGADALAWFCGLQQAVMMAVDRPRFFQELLGIIDNWNRPRMAAFLDFGVDLFIRRAWYHYSDVS